jgi:uncharacterized membrane protein
MIPHPQMLFGVLMLAVAALVATVFWLLPDWSRPGIFFAVTVVPSFRDSPEAARVLRSYRAQVMVHVLMAFGLIVIGGLLAGAVGLILGTLWLAAGPLIAVARAHAQALPHAVAHSTIREASLTPRSTQMPGGWILQIGPLAILAVVALYLSAHWSDIPEQFPVHWGLSGRPDGYSFRTPVGVYGPLMYGAALLIGISLLAYAFSHFARHVPVAGDAPGMTHFPHRVAVLLLAAEYFIAAMFSLVGMLPLTGSPGVAPIVILSVAILASAVFLARWSHRWRGRLPQGAGDGTPDDCWKLGIFYFNPDDAALFVEKRVGFGYTVNFARGGAWVILVLTLLVPLGLTVLVSRNHP